MAQLVGTRLGSFEVLSSLGAGGMGEVYRGRDARLGREVALKILPERFAREPERLSRFKREAQLLASLNHTNIAVLYDVEELDGVHALVMEFIDGETLADRLERGPLSSRDAIAVASQIVDGLEAAHERGVIHRDLKPSNIAIRDDGHVKLLDFGLAKALDASLPSGSSDPTMISPVTQLGVVVGTPAYMSPEQVQGRAVDSRSDIWSFGCVLYEMLTGKPAFAGESTADTLTAVMAREPEWGALPAKTPTALIEVVRWCLEKDRKQRLAHIADARPGIREALASRELPATVSPRTRRREVVAWIIAALSLAILAIGAAYLVAGRQMPPMVRFAVSVPQKAGRDPRIALSPDGKSLVFVAPGPTQEDLLWIRPLNELEARPLAGTEEATSPFWSPDNRSIAFFAQGKLKRIPASGGTAQTLVDGLRPQIGGTGGTWNANDVIVFAQVFGPLQAVSAEGGRPSPVTKVVEERQEFGHYNPVFLPDGEHLVYDVGASLENSGLYASSLTSTEKTRILAKRVFPFLVTSNRFLLFVEDGLLKAQRLDFDRLQLTGNSFPIANGISAISVSTNGTLAYRPTVAPRTQLTWLDRRGTVLGTVGRPGRYEVIALSPDDTRAAFARDGDVWLLDVARGNETRITSDPAFDGFPAWSFDGTHILYAHGVVGGGAMGGTLMRKPSSGAGVEEVLLEQRILYPVEASADGRFLTYVAPGATQSLDLYVLPLTGDRKPAVFLDTRFQEVGNRLSADGKSMAYVSDETGQPEVYVQTYPRSEKRWKISEGGGTQPMWRRDGRELFFVGHDGTLMAVAVKTMPAFEPAVPQPLFRVNVEPLTGAGVVYAPARDGQRFLVSSAVEGAESSIVLVLNWSRDLPER